MIRIDTVVISTQHSPEVSNAQLREEVIEHIIKPMLPVALYLRRLQLIHKDRRFTE